MSNNLDDRYDHYADEFNPLKHDRRARKKRKKSANHQPKVTDEEILEQIADLSGTEALDFETTYTPSLYERDWLYSSLRTFYDRALTPLNKLTR